jgi:hypothetical protein
MLLEIMIDLFGCCPQFFTLLPMFPCTVFASGGASANTIDEWFAMMGHGSAPAIAKTVAQPSRQVMVVDATKYGEHPHSKPKSEVRVLYLMDRVSS